MRARSERAADSQQKKSTCNRLQYLGPGTRLGTRAANEVPSWAVWKLHLIWGEQGKTKEEEANQRAQEPGVDGVSMCHSIQPQKYDEFIDVHSAIWVVLYSSWIHSIHQHFLNSRKQEEDRGSRSRSILVLCSMNAESMLLFLKIFGKTMVRFVVVMAMYRDVVYGKSLSNKTTHHSDETCVYRCIQYTCVSLCIIVWYAAICVFIFIGIDCATAEE